MPCAGPTHTLVPSRVGSSSAPVAVGAGRQRGDGLGGDRLRYGNGLGRECAPEPGRRGRRPVRWLQWRSPVAVVVAGAAGAVPEAIVVAVTSSGVSGGGALRRLDDRTELDDAGHVDGVERLLLVLHAGQVDDDRLALDTDVGLGDPLVLELAADQVADDDQVVTRRGLDGRQDDRHAALEVEAEDRGGAGGDRCR